MRVMALLERDEVEQRLAEADGWELEDRAIVKRFERGDFSGAVAFVVALEPVANELGHHPDVSISWDTVTVLITTHSAGGLTAADFDLAARIDALEAGPRGSAAQ
jgi:4a-hydroxytetrahydrobiopterin dehydratase